MTDEEMAEEFVGSKKSFWRQGRTCIESVKQAFLVGLKAGRDMAEADIATIAYMQGAERYKPKWHKVADGDYPPVEVGNYSVDVWTDRGDIAYYVYSNNCWCVEPSTEKIEPPVAWCEIPKYTEE